MSSVQDPARPSRPHAAVGYAVAVAGAIAAALVAILVDARVDIPNLSLIFVLPVVAAAALFGWGPSLAAAVLGVLAYNYFLIEPRYTLRVAEASNVWALALLLVVAAAVSAVAASARRRTMEALDAAAKATALRSLGRDLVAETTRAGVAAKCAEALEALFAAPALVFIETPDGEAVVEARGAAPKDVDLEAVRWSLAEGLPTRGGAYPTGDTIFDFWPIVTPQRQRAVVGVAISGDPEGRPAEPERLIDVVTSYLAVAVDRETYARQALNSRVAAAGEAVKSELLAAVSHDLKTPLATILVSLQTLQRFPDGHDAKTTAALLAAAETETARLARMVENLLDMNRIEAGAAAVKAVKTSAADLVVAALDRASPALAGRSLINRAVAGPELFADPGMFETALANVLENAGKYSPAGSRVEIDAGEESGMGWVEVADEGPGFGGSSARLFEKFARGVEGDGRPPGTGLGLSIARSFLEAQGGRVEAHDRPNGGARVRLIAPLAAGA